MAEDTLFPNSDPSWKDQAAKEYLERRKALSEKLQQLKAEIDGLNAQIRQISEQIEFLDQAAQTFGLPVPANIRIGGNLEIRDQRLFKDVVLLLLERAYPKPRKAAEIRKAAQEILGQEFHRKTAGMTLYRLSKEGRVRREGHNWFYVPEKEEGPESSEPSADSSKGAA